jgi:hypothetical protein
VALNADATVTALGETSNGGLFAGGGGNANADLNFAFNLTVDGNLTAGGLLDITSDVTAVGDADAQSDAGGLGAGATTNANARVGTAYRAAKNLEGNRVHMPDPTLVRITIDEHADLRADNVNISADINKLTADSHSDVTVGGGGGFARAFAHSKVEANSEVILKNLSEITGDETIQIEARVSDIDNKAWAEGTLYAFAGWSTGHAETTTNTETKVEGEWEAILTTAQLDVKSEQHSIDRNARGVGNGIFIGPGYDEEDEGDLNVYRNIFWESHVILLGEPNPELEIDENGEIVKLTNVEFLG